MPTISLVELAVLLNAIPDAFWIAGALFFALVILRYVMVAQRAARLEGSAMGIASTQLDRLAAENEKLHLQKIKLIGFATRTMRFLSHCMPCCHEQDERRLALQAEYEALLSEVA
jgi:hypothetical protein